MALSQTLGGDNQWKAAAGVRSRLDGQATARPLESDLRRARVGGAWVYIHTTGNPVIGQNSALIGMIVLACHEVDAIEEIYFGDVEVKFDAERNALGKWRNYLRTSGSISARPDQAADPKLIRWGDGTWTGAHVSPDAAISRLISPIRKTFSRRCR